MEKIRICIGSNDGENIVKSHMGDAQFFYIYDILNNRETKFVEKKINSAKDIKHGKADKMQEIIKILKDTDIFVANKMSPNFKKIAQKTMFQPLIVKEEKLEDILNILKNKFAEIDELVTKRKNAEYLESIPELA